MRWWVAVVLVAGCGDRAGSDAEPADAAADSAAAAACATWNPASCSTDGVNVCFYECLPEVRIQCTRRECFLTGAGHGGGEACVVSVGERQVGCGFCETAFAECR